MPTIRDVAREAGVSIATVSYVLNNKDYAVSAATRQDVLDAAERIGYRPNVTARNLRSNQTRLIGYAWYELVWHQMPQGRLNTVLEWFTYYLARSAEIAGYHLLTFTCPPNNPVPVYDELIRTGRVDAFVLAGTTYDDQRVEFLMNRHFPFASFGRSNEDWNFSWVDTDGAHGIKAAVEYLLELGHQRIAMIAWPEDSLSGQYRYSGYVKALEAAGIPLREDYVYRGEHREQTGRDAVAWWMRMSPDERPTAIVAITDLIAVGVMNEAQARGLEIGRDLSVIGSDDAPMTEYLRPALTTIQQPIPQICEALINMLDSTLNKQSELSQTLLLPPKLIIRQSCAPPLR